MAKMKKKRLGGFRNIHMANLVEGVYADPVAIKGGKSINAELNYEQEEFESDDEVDYSEFIFTGGEGTLALASLIPEEYTVIFGNKKVKGGVAVKTSDLSPNNAIMFERQKKDRVNKRLYVIYNTKFAPSSIKAESAAKIGNEEIDELKYSVGSNDGLIYHFIDTDDPTVTQDQITNWYTEVQMPIDLDAVDPAQISEVSIEPVVEEVTEKKEPKKKSK